MVYTVAEKKTKERNHISFQKKKKNIDATAIAWGVRLRWIKRGIMKQNDMY